MLTIETWRLSDDEPIDLVGTLGDAMNRPNDELDNLLRDHLAGELDSMRGQARRAFEREVVAPMQHRLRQRAWQQVRTRITHAAPLVMSMAACAALGFYVPRFLSGPATPNMAIGTSTAGKSLPQIAEITPDTVTRTEEHGLAALPDGSAGRRVVANQVESASWVDPQTNARTEFYVFPTEQEVISSAGRQ